MILFLSEQKDTLNCEKCLRKVGLWLYDRVKNYQEDPESKLIQTEFQSEKTNHESDSNELIIKNIISKIVNIISINEENKSTKTNNRQNQPTVLKRKSENLDASFDSKKGKKNVNPLAEHQNWCPWLFKNDSQMTTIILEDKTKKIIKNISIITYEIVCRLKNIISQDENLKYKKEKLEKSLTSSDVITSESLMARIKAVQSILVNCSSQLSQF